MPYRYVFLGCALILAGACSGSPTATQITPPVNVGPVVVNTPPKIGAFTVQGTRANEPVNFADVNEEVPISVSVTDDESNVSDLKFNWSAAVGTFSGTGAKVTWKAPSSAQAPTDVNVNLEVVETYASQGKSIDNRVTGSTTLSLHDSVKEVGDMGRQFLLDFSDSQIQDIAYIMRNFQQGCYGTADETSQVTDNRRLYHIDHWRVQEPVTTIGFGGICPFPGRTLPGDGCSLIRTWWQSTVLIAHDGRSAGDIENASGIDHIQAKYYADQRRWKLCDSSFEPDDPPQTSLRAIPRGLVP